jgi:multisubunit Na+/H+ antiporter MnhG subunit
MARLLGVFIHFCGENNSQFYIVLLSVAVFRIITPVLKKDLLQHDPGGH